MRFKIKTTYKDDETGEQSWWEEYEKDRVEDAQAWAEKTIEQFNATLRYGEKPRRLLDVVVIDRDTKKDHDWRKESLTMKRAHWRGGQVYDEYQCAACGITGKGYGVPPTMRRDSQYRAKVYERCDTAQEHLTEHGHPKP